MEGGTAMAAIRVNTRNAQRVSIFIATPPIGLRKIIKLDGKVGENVPGGRQFTLHLSHRGLSLFRRIGYSIQAVYSMSSGVAIV